MRLRQEKRRRSAGSSAAEDVRNSAGIDAVSEIEVKDMINGKLGGYGSEKSKDEEKNS